MDRHQTDAAEQATRRSACKRPSRAQRHLLGPAFQVHGGAPCSRIIADTRLLQSLRSLAGVWDQIMDALTAAHDAAVQMIDTSVVRVHQHGACVADNKHYRAMSLHSGSPQSREYTFESGRILIDLSGGPCCRMSDFSKKAPATGAASENELGRRPAWFCPEWLRAG
jgi:hypothetical protein